MDTGRSFLQALFPSSIGNPKTTESQFKPPDIPDTECAICKEPFEEASEFPVILRCGHVFGNDCINEWIAQQSTSQKCPICAGDPFLSTKERRGEEVEENEDDEEDDDDENDDEDIGRAWEEVDTPNAPIPPMISNSKPISWARRSVPGDPWLIRIGNVRFNDLHEVANTLLSLLVAQDAPGLVSSGLGDPRYRIFVRQWWNLLEDALREKAVLDGPWEDLLEVLLGCRAEFEDEGVSPILRTGLMIRTIVLQTQYLDADVGQRIRLGLWLTRPGRRSFPCISSPPGVGQFLEESAGMLTRGLKDNLDVMFAEWAEGGRVRTQHVGFPYVLQYLVATGKEPWVVTSDLELVASDVDDDDIEVDAVMDEDGH